jgi:hypothetical protein
MNFLSFNISDILSSLCKIGVYLTEKQLVTLKWRLSNEGQKLYSQEETNNFYKALRNGDTTIIDSVRKEKQNIIDSLKLDLDLL